LGYRGERAVFTQPLRSAHGPPATTIRGTLRRPFLGFGIGDVDDAEDETICTSSDALQDTICPDFGQSPEAAAMGEDSAIISPRASSRRKRRKRGVRC
jgi:hypothetical protein